MPLRESINVALSEFSRSYIQLRDANARPDRLVAGVLARLTGCQTKNVSDFALSLLGLLQNLQRYAKAVSLNYRNKV
jgi:hypothetical protein